MPTTTYTREDRQAMIDSLDSAYATYILRCKPIEPQYISEVAKEHLDTCPTWAKIACEYSNIYYIGSTSDPIRRIGSHLNGRGAEFTRVFSVERVEQVRVFEGENVARQVEGQLAREYRRGETRYCYSDKRKGGN